MIPYAIYVGSAALGFAFLFGAGSAVVWWRDRQVRRDRAYWDS